MVLALNSTAQDQNNLALDAIVRDMNGGKLAGVRVKIIQDGVLINQMTTGKNGRFDVLLDFDHQFLIEMSKSSYVSKSIQVNTRNVPEDEQAWGYEYGGLAIDLFEQIPSVDYSILDGPVAKFYYDPNLQNFDYDKLYSKQNKQKIEDLEEEYERKKKMAEELYRQAERDYLLAMKDADNAFNDGDYLLAKENYLAAASMKPDAKDPQAKLKQIESKVQEASGKEEQYMSLLANADQLFNQQKFSEAQLQYEQASTIKPSEKYPKDRIEESKKLYKVLKAKQEAEALLAEKDRNYNEEIGKADREFIAENFANAKTYYQNALGLKPDEQYPKKQIAQAELKIQELREKEKAAEKMAILNEKYDAQIARGDAAFNSDNFQNAANSYRAAAELKPKETYPKTQLDIIVTKQRELAAAELEAERLEKQNREYQQFIAEADRSFDKGEYAEAKKKYEQALAIKTDNYPSDRIDEIGNLLEEQRIKAEEDAQQAQIEQAYRSAIEKADLAAKKFKYDEAISLYDEARSIKLAEEYPKQQIEQMNRLKQQDQSNKSYADLIARADAAFNKKDYYGAQAIYTQADAAKPDDIYPSNRLKEITSILYEQRRAEEESAKLAQLSAEYNEAIKLGDAAFESQDFDNAEQHYKRAQGILSSEEYPGNQLMSIKEVRQKVAEEQSRLAEEKRLRYEYEAQISKADKLFGQKAWNEAIRAYEQATIMDWSEEYPKAQIEKINSIIQEEQRAQEQEKERLANEKEKQEKEDAYKKMIGLADGFFESGNYIKAKSYYNNVIAIKSDDDYSKSQIQIINERLAEIQSQAQLKEEDRQKYNDLITQGDRAVTEKRWNDARKAFTDALKIYPNEEIPAARLKEIDDLEEKEKQEELDAEIARLTQLADKFFVTKEFDSAQKNYESVLNLDPSNKHAKVRLEKINEIIEAAQKIISIDEKRVERVVKEENFKEGNADVTIRTITEGQKVDIYKRVVHSWGGKYFFLNEQPISELVWNRDSAE